MKSETASSALSAAGRYYNIHGVSVSLELADEEMASQIRRRFAPYEAAEDGGGQRGGLKIELSTGDRLYPVPLHAARVLRYGPLRSYFINGRTYFTDYFSTMEIDPAGERVVGNISPETLKEFGVNFLVDLMFTLTLFEALRFHGLFYLHSAALVGPDGSGYMISGNAGSGKTSLTMCLIETGFRFLSDDTVFLSLVDDGSVEVRGLAREFHVPADLVKEGSRFNHLEALPDYSSFKKKKTLSPDEWFPEKRLEVMKDPRTLVFPTINKEEGFEVLSSSAGLALLLPQSLSVMFNPLLARDHLEAIKRAVAGSTSFRLANGPSLKGDPEKVRDVFERMRDQSPRKEKK